MPYVIGAVFAINLALMLCLCYYDARKYRPLPPSGLSLSFLVPVFNNQRDVKATIDSIYAATAPQVPQVIIVNDCSTDNTGEVLRQICREYPLTILDNERNMGKSISVNRAFQQAEGDIIVSMDADVILDRRALNDALSRLQANPRIGGVSCRYEVLNTSGILPTMQRLEYNFIALFLGTHNVYSCIAMLGGFMVLKRRAFAEVGGLSVNAITEDTDLGLKLNEKGWKVEMSFCGIRTEVPETLSVLYRQKLRWNTGFVQCVLRHPRVYFRNPVFLFFVIVGLSIPSFFFLSQAAAQETFDIAGLVRLAFWGNGTWRTVGFGILFLPLLSAPYAVLRGDRLDIRLNTLWLVYPFALVYGPMLLLFFLEGIPVGIYRTWRLKEGQIAWQGST